MALVASIVGFVILALLQGITRQIVLKNPERIAIGLANVLSFTSTALAPLSGFTSFVASSVSKLIQRVTGNPINVPKTYVDNLNIVVITQMVRLANGKAARKLTSINEIISYDSVSDSFSL